MVSTRSTNSRQVVQEAVPSSDSGEDYDPEKEPSCSVVTRGSKSRTARKATVKEKGKQPEKRRNAGKLSRLPDMPLDVLYEVSYRPKFIADDGMDDDPPAIDRYSLLSVQWICCGCRGLARPFVMFSQASPRDRFG